MEMETLYPDGVENCSCFMCDYWGGVLKDLGNGKIALGIRYSLYILDKQTLKVEQKIEESFKYETDFTYIDSWYDPNTNKSIILLKGTRLNYRTFSYDKDTKKYEESGRFGSSSNNMKLTGINEAYSFELNQLLHWNKVENQILHIN